MMPMALVLDTDITMFERFLLSVLKEELSEFHRERRSIHSKEFPGKISNMRPDFDYEDWEEIYTKYKNTDIEEAKELIHRLMLSQCLKITEKGEGK